MVVHDPRWSHSARVDPKVSQLFDRRLTDVWELCVRRGCAESGADRGGRLGQEPRWEIVTDNVTRRRGLPLKTLRSSLRWRTRELGRKSVPVTEQGR